MTIIQRYVATGAIVVALAAAREGRAIPYYQGSVIGQCATHNGVTYNVVVQVTAPQWSLTGNGLQYVFNPAPAQSTSVDLDARNRYYAVTPGNYTVVVGNPQHQGTYTITAPNCAQSTSKGMTWSLLGTNPVTGTIRVGCKAGCDPRKGDTPCTTPLPLLCIRKSGPGFPLPVPVGVDNSDQYNKWAGGIVATTKPMVPPSTLGAADAVCATEFGPNWRVAEFHDGWGWHFLTYGGVGAPAQRFWTHINDQPGATCWK